MVEVIFTRNEARKFSIRHRRPMKAVVDDVEFVAKPVPDLRDNRLEWYCRDKRVMQRRLAMADS